MSKVKDFRPATRNANQHTARGIGALQASVQQDGWIGAMTTAADGEMIAGSARIETAAQVFGVDAEPIVIESDGTRPIIVKRTDIPQADDPRAVRLALADNRVQELDLTWDVEVLAGLDADVLDGLWTADELSDLGQQWADEHKPAQDDPGAQIDKAEELQAKWNVQPGDLWQLGAHRLICGDCTDVAVVARVMGGEKAQLVVTSPPYWVGKDYETQTTLQEVRAFIDACCESMTSAANSDGGRIIINCSTASARAINPKADVETMFTLAWWQDAMRGRNWLMRHCRVWIKGGDMGAPSVAARSDVVDQHWETIPEFLPTFYYPDGLRRGQEKIGMKWAQLGVWNDIRGERSADDTHCAAFPVELPSRYIRLYTVFNESVFEPFGGSGTTIIACERLGRKCRAIEIAPKYCAVALERFYQMSGVLPVLIPETAGA